jgi:2-desacetyl-2-hydroxyethyl bacteriochlorophyllide A dehydrogenase
MKRLALEFTAPFRVSVVEERLDPPPPHQVLVKSLVSAVSSGTEMLVYRGEWPENLAIDESIPALAGKFAYPLKYGYSAVGRVTEVGSDAHSDWLGRNVFSFNPHESAFLARPEQLIPLPDSLTPEEAAFLPNMETAVSFLMDGVPLIGERVTIFGQGVVGLLTAALLARMPLGCLVTLDRYLLRREKSLAVGASASLDPVDDATAERLKQLLQVDNAGNGADLTYELSGNPLALDMAISLAGFDGRIVVGSWYGKKRVEVDLGGRFHRGRIHLVSSQVSTLSPGLSGRWSKARRLDLALRMLHEIRPAGLITHRIPISRAADAYAVLHQTPGDAIGVMLTYEETR